MLYTHIYYVIYMYKKNLLIFMFENYIKSITFRLNLKESRIKNVLKY